MPPRKDGPARTEGRCRCCRFSCNAWRWRGIFAERSDPDAPKWRRTAGIGFAGLCVAVGAFFVIAALLGLFSGEPPPPAPAPPPAHPPETPRAPVAFVEPGRTYATLSWPRVDGAVGYLVQEWSWNRLHPDRGYYYRRQLNRTADSADFIFQVAYEGIELPDCGTVEPVPHARLHIPGGAELVMDWQVRSVGPTGLRSGWSSASNRLALPGPWDRAVDPVENNCSACASGTYRRRRHSNSHPPLAGLCQLCPAGTHAPRGAAECTACAAGRVDHDADARTPCVDCAAGQHGPGRLGGCTSCPAGTIDHDGDPATQCRRCPPGTASLASGQIGPCQPCAGVLLVSFFCLSVYRWL